MAIRTETDRAPARPRRTRSRDERLRAARYLDLWERHLADRAVHAPAPAPVARPCRYPPRER